MNREIKFRGKRVDNEKFVKGDLLHGVNHKKGKMYILPIIGGVMGLGHGLDPLDGYEVMSETVGQYTGLKDKNGKEIYEGDIVQITIGGVKFNFGVVTFGKFKAEIYECYGWYVYLNGKQTSEAGLYEEFEIVGNVYENPELLKQ